MEWAEIATIRNMIIACNEEPNQSTGWAVSRDLTVHARGTDRRATLPKGWRMLLKDGIDPRSREACRHDAWEPDDAVTVAWWTRGDPATLKVARIEPVGPAHGITGRARTWMIDSLTRHIEREGTPA